MPEQSIFGGFKIKLTVWPLKRSETILQTIGCIIYYDKHAQYYTYPVAGMSSAFLNMTHRVKFLVEIENFTNQPLHWVKLEMKSGGFHNCPPIVIMAGHKGSFCGRKISYALAGASGAVSYRIGDSAKVIVISFFCPYSFIWSGGNTLALKFYQWDQSQIEKMPRMYDQMNIEGPWKKSFRSGGPPLHVTDGAGEYCMKGTMGTDHSTIVKVSLYPKDENKLATRLKPGFGVQESSGVAGVVKAFVKVLEDVQEYASGRCNVA